MSSWPLPFSWSWPALRPMPMAFRASTDDTTDGDQPADHDAHDATHGHGKCDSAADPARDGDGHGDGNGNGNGNADRAPAVGRPAVLPLHRQPAVHAAARLVHAVHASA